jgi:aspartate/methionine/tyrosine aminotransferase
MIRLSKKMHRLGTESAFQVLAQAQALEAKGAEVIHLEIGEPDFDTAKNICDAASKALNEGCTHYCSAQGLPELRRSIAKEMAREHEISIDPERIVVTPGAKPIMFYAILALLDEGDEAIYPNPGFPIYESVINFSGAKAVPIPLREELDFRLDVDELRAKVTKHTKLIIINSPQNPTGGVLEEDDIHTIAELAQENGITILSDEVYDHIIYETKPYSIVRVPGMLNNTILLNGFSKTYAMTGWRLGYAILPPDLVTHVVRLIINSVSCTSPFTQYAGIEALTGPQDKVSQMVTEFKKRRDLIVDGLNNIPGISCRLPKGAFYAFPNVKKIGMDSKSFADHLLNEAGVATVDGAAFGQYGEGYLRLSYATSQENITKALERIKSVVSRINV